MIFDSATKKHLVPTIFMHIQKTAGTSLVSHIRSHYGDKNVMSHADHLAGFTEAERPTFFRAENITARHNNIPFISGHFGYSFCSAFMKDRYSFTFLRDPAERILSSYYYYRSQPPELYHVYALAHEKSLEEFLQLGLTDPAIKGYIWNNQAWQLAHGYSNNNGRGLLKFSEDEISELALKNIKTFSFVGTMENFQRDFDIVLKALDIPLPKKILKENVGNNRPAVKDLPESTQELLRKLTAIEQPIYDFILTGKFESPTPSLCAESYSADSIAEHLSAGLMSRSGDAAFIEFKGRITQSAPKLMSVLKEMHRTAVSAKVPAAVNSFLASTLDVNIVDVDFPACRDSGLFTNTFAPARILCSLAKFCKNSEPASNFLRKLTNADSKNYRFFVAYSWLLMEEGHWREAADAALQARKLKSYDLAIAKAVNNTQKALYDNGLAPDIPPNLRTDNNQRFCQMAFTDIRILSTNYGKGKISVFNCSCGSWQLVSFAEDLSWNSEDMQEFRRSILTGNYKYCDDARCTLLRDGSLPLKKNIANQYFRKIIDNNLVILPEGPHNAQLAYDFDCNLSCPSCRAKVYKMDDVTLTAFDDMASKLVVPLLPSIKSLRISQAGEALASRHSMRLLKSLTPDKYPNLKVLLLTNMALVSPKKWEELGESAKCIKTISMSIDGATQKTVEKLRRGLKWPRLLEALDFVRSLRKNGELELVNLTCVIQKSNYMELEDLLKLASEYCVDTLSVAPLFSPGSYNPNEYFEENVSNPNNKLFTHCKEHIERCKKLHAEMMLNKKEIELSGSSVPNISWYLW
ncbi:MAG: sulfotransferase family 2 domain-containing protein [Deltaproteobacteria bacterium]|jgi:hypothetical protein|nr:sulfotransferase family 2 domain-containing protein [Deltaproteobacteria bacterium]